MSKIVPQDCRTLLCLPDAIGDSVIALPALHAVSDVALTEPVFAVSSCVVIELLRNEFPSWQWWPLNLMSDLTNLTPCIAIDFAGLSWSTKLLKSISCQRKIGPAEDHVGARVFSELVPIGPFGKDTSACELFNPIARHLGAGHCISGWPSFRAYEQATLESQRRVALIPGAGCRAKRWPFECFLQVDQWLKEREFETEWFVGPMELDLLEDLANEPLVNVSSTFSGILQAFRTCAVVIGNDTGLLHVSAAIGVPTVGIFGPSVPGQWGPYPFPYRFVQHKLAGREAGLISGPNEAYHSWPSVESVIDAMVEVWKFDADVEVS